MLSTFSRFLTTSPYRHPVTIYLIFLPLGSFYSTTLLTVTELYSINHIFTDRELATLVILWVVISFALLNPDTRSALGPLSKAFFKIKIQLVNILYLFYVSIIFWMAWRLGWLDLLLVKDALILVFLTGFGMVYSAYKHKDANDLLLKTFKNTLGLSVLLGFYMNISSFNILIEIPLQIVIAALSAMLAYEQVKNRTGQALVNIIVGLLTVIATIMIFKTSSELFSSISAVDRSMLYRSFILAVVFPFTLIPFIYLLGLFARLELIFNGLSSLNKNMFRRKKLTIHLISSINIGLHGSLKYANAFSGQWFVNILNADSFSDALFTMKQFRMSVRETEYVSKAKSLRLRRYANSGEVDDNGRQLDIREFKQTKEVLKSLFITQKNYFNNGHPPGYRDEHSLLFFGGGNIKHIEANMNVELSPDGTTWRAWRRTPSGWHFAIGGCNGANEMWLYDGEKPPEDFPSACSKEWVNASNSNSPKNWREEAELFDSWFCSID